MAHHHWVSMVNPARIKAYAASQLARHKTDRLEAHGLRPMQVLTALMRKLLHFAYGVLKSGQPYRVSLKEVLMA